MSSPRLPTSAHQQTQSNSFRPFNGYTATRPALLSLAKLLFVGVANLPFIRAAPTRWSPYTVLTKNEDNPMAPDKPTLWIYLAVAIGLVLLGGAFAGLTIALMGQDEIYLQVIRTSGEGSEKNHAAKVLRLLKRGKHWVLVTLLLGNVITNETLPIVLDRSLGGGWPAVLGSTVLIVIFGEIVPQSICVRYGLPIGAIMSPFVLVLMYILGPVAWPTAKLLDKLLGEDHGTTYKKAGLKTLVTLHKTLGSAGEQLNSDEVTIISAVLDLKEKPVGSIMTPMDDVYTMSADAVLDEALMDEILSAGYSRIPIYEPSNPQNFVGMLLVKILITYDPEDGKRVRDFALATLPETRPETSCLDIVNFFQEGKSHMVLVSEFPGDEKGAQGVVTLEDVIEELIGEEIIDESDVFIDVSKRLRRRTAAPRSRVPKGEIVNEPDIVRIHSTENLIDVSDDHKDEAKPNGDGDTSKISAAETESSPKKTSFLRRTSSTAGASERSGGQKRGPPMNIRDQLRNLGPSNVASRPRQTRYNTVKIKPGSGGRLKGSEASDTRKSQPNLTAPHEGTELLIDAGKDASDGVLTLHAGYGSMDPKTPKSPQRRNRGVQVNDDDSGSTLQPTSEPGRQRSGSVQRPGSGHGGRSRSNTINTSESREGSKSPGPKRSVARSGSLSENIIDAGGIRKVVLETTSSSDDTEAQRGVNGGAEEQKENGKLVDESEDSKSGKKKRRRKRKKAGKSGKDTTLVEEDEP